MVNAYSSTRSKWLSNMESQEKSAHIPELSLPYQRLD